VGPGSTSRPLQFRLPAALDPEMAIYFLLQTPEHLSSALSQAFLSASVLAALKHAAWDIEQSFMQAARGLIFAFGWGNSNAHVSSKRANPSFI
jgi:hypothetical protein